MATTVAPAGFVPYERPPELSRCEALSLMLWNPEKKAVLGRTAKSWGGIILFYICFYAGLAALFAVCMQGLFYTLNERQPRWQQKEGLIGDNPGMGFRPLAEDVENAGSLIWFDAQDNRSISRWTHRIDEFLKTYAEPSTNEVVCDFEQLPDNGKVCKVDVSEFGGCTSANEYGFRKSAPCFFVKLNRIIGWEPDVYTRSDTLPDDMPEELQEHIQTAPANQSRVVWVSCEGENPADRENIGQLAYWPMRGLPAYYYPYENQEAYASPLVAVQLLRPKRNVLINVECRAWAKNIRYSKVKGEREGSVHLELMVD